MDVAAACAAQRPMLVPGREGVIRCTMVTPGNGRIVNDSDLGGEGAIASGHFNLP